MTNETHKIEAKVSLKKYILKIMCSCKKELPFPV